MKARWTVSKVLLSCSVLVATVSAPQSASAAIVTGDLDISGALSLTSTSELTFLPPVAGGGQFIVGAGTGRFAPLAGTSGKINNIDLIPGSADVPAFLTLASEAGIQFRLSFILGGIFSLSQCGAPPLVGQQCSPAIPGVGFSALNLLNTQHGSTLSFEINGAFVDTAGAEQIPYAGLFTAQFAQRYQDVFAAFENGQSVTTTYSATFQQIGAPIPELPQATLLGVGIAALWVFALGRVRQRHPQDHVDLVGKIQDPLPDAFLA